MLDVRRLRLLRELSHRGTIAAVAEALVLTPSAVSQQLAVLEREAGVALLERTGRRVALTPAAHGLVRHAEGGLAQLEQGGAEPVGIGPSPPAARALLPAALVELARRHPDLEPMVTEIDPAGVADALRSGDLDVALTHAYDLVPAAVEAGVESAPLCAERMFVACH